MKNEESYDSSCINYDTYLKKKLYIMLRVVKRQSNKTIIKNPYTKIFIKQNNIWNNNLLKLILPHK